MATDIYDEFLEHSGREQYGKFFGNWKKRTPPRADVWLHTGLAPKPSWRHQFYRVETRENKETKEEERVVWSMTFNCHEHESVLKKQFKLDDDGYRLVPPEKCPMCRMVECIRAAVVEKRLSPLEPIFRFVGDDEDEATELVAIGLLNAFPKSKEGFAAVDKSGERQNDDEYALPTYKEFRDAELSLKDGWKQNAMAKLSYVFAIVDNDDPSRGVQIATETGLLGDKVKGVIADRRDQLGSDEGSLAKNPAAIRWMHKPDEQEFGKKYHALLMPKLPLTDEIEALIRSDPPDLTSQLDPGDTGTLRALMERYALVDLPFDEIFAGHSSTPRDSKDKAKTGSSSSSKKPLKDEEEEDEIPTRQKKAAEAKKPDPKSKKKDEPIEFECSECGEGLRASDTECPKCGTPVDDDETESAEDTPPPKKSMAAAAPAKKSAAAAAPPRTPMQKAKKDVPF